MTMVDSLFSGGPSKLRSKSVWLNPTGHYSLYYFSAVKERNRQDGHDVSNTGARFKRNTPGKEGRKCFI